MKVTKFVKACAHWRILLQKALYFKFVQQMLVNPLNGKVSIGYPEISHQHPSRYTCMITNSFCNDI